MNDVFFLPVIDAVVTVTNREGTRRSVRLLP